MSVDGASFPIAREVRRQIGNTPAGRARRPRRKTVRLSGDRCEKKPSSNAPRGRGWGPAFSRARGSSKETQAIS